MAFDRRHAIALGILALFVIAMLWMLSAAMPTFWCSLLGSCNM